MIQNILEDQIAEAYKKIVKLEHFGDDSAVFLHVCTFAARDVFVEKINTSVVLSGL